MPKDTLSELEEQAYEIEGNVPPLSLGRRGLDLSMSLRSFEEDGVQDRGLFAAFEGSSKHGKYRGGGMFYGGRRPKIRGDYGIGGPRYGGFYIRPFSIGYNEDRNGYPAGFGNRDRYPGREFYRQSYTSPY